MEEFWPIPQESIQVTETGQNILHQQSVGLLTFQA